MGVNPNSKMGTGVKVFLWVIGIMVAIILAIAIPALIQQRQRARVLAANRQREAQEDVFYARALKLLNSSQTLHAGLNMTCRAYGAPHVSVGRAAMYPDMALVTIVWPNIQANQIMINPDETRTGVVPPMMQSVRLDTIPVSTTNWNCRVDNFGNILLPPLEQDCLQASTTAP